MEDKDLKKIAQLGKKFDDGLDTMADTLIKKDKITGKEVKIK